MESVKVIFHMQCKESVQIASEQLLSQVAILSLVLDFIMSPFSDFIYCHSTNFIRYIHISELFLSYLSS